MVMMLYFDVASSDMDRVAEKKMDPDILYPYPYPYPNPSPTPIPYTAYQKGSLYITIFKEGGIDAGAQKPSGARVETSLRFKPSLCLDCGHRCQYKPHCDGGSCGPEGL